MQLPPEVFDLFAVPADAVPVDGGRGRSVLAGDLVLSPGRDAATADWLNPVLARLAAELDHAEPRALRIAMPIPTRDLRWVVDGWGATRYEPGARPCHDLDVLLATGRLLHAHLAAGVTSSHLGLTVRDDRWARAERAAFTDGPVADDPAGRVLRPREVQALVTDLRAALSGLPSADQLGPDQLVHGDLAGNVILDAMGLPVVLDMAPYWRPALWAEAVCVLDAVLWHGADTAVLREWREGPRRQAMLRAGIFRVLSDQSCDITAYREVLGAGVGLGVGGGSMSVVVPMSTER